MESWNECMPSWRGIVQTAMPHRLHSHTRGHAFVLPYLCSFARDLGSGTLLIREQRLTRQPQAARLPMMPVCSHYSCVCLKGSMHLHFLVSVCTTFPLASLIWPLPPISQVSIWASKVSRNNTRKSWDPQIALPASFALLKHNSPSLCGKWCERLNPCSLVEFWVTSTGLRWKTASAPYSLL